jgi:hypothetical protein
MAILGADDLELFRCVRVGKATRDFEASAMERSLR